MRDGESSDKRRGAPHRPRATAAEDLALQASLHGLPLTQVVSLNGSAGLCRLALRREHAHCTRKR